VKWYTDLEIFFYKNTGLFSKESGLLVVLATVLIARTWLDIWFSGFNG
jgi:hypothetical protein